RGAAVAPALGAAVGLAAGWIGFSPARGGLRAAVVPSAARPVRPAVPVTVRAAAALPVRPRAAVRSGCGRRCALVLQSLAGRTVAVGGRRVERVARRRGVPLPH